MLLLAKRSNPLKLFCLDIFTPDSIIGFLEHPSEPHSFIFKMETINVHHRYNSNTTMI